MAAERDNDLPPVQPARRTAVVRGLRPRLWPKRVIPRNPAGHAPDRPSGPSPESAAAPAPAPPPEAPLTYDDHAHLHGGPGSAPRLDLED